MKFSAAMRSVSAFFFGTVTDLDELDGLDEQGRRRIRAAQIATVIELVPMSMSMNVLNALIVVYVFRDSEQIGFLVSWALTVLAAVAVSFWSWRRSRQKTITEASERAVRRMNFADILDMFAPRIAAAE